MTSLLAIQQEAPFFRALNQEQKLLSLADFAGEKTVVLYFYPKDDTPGCTIEAKQFTALADEFAALNCLVLGVSKDDCASHRDFINKYNLSVQLLADTDGSLCESYGVWQEVEKDGVKKWKIVRSTFIINPKGILIDVEYGVDPEGHAQRILDKIREIG